MSARPNKLFEQGFFLLDAVVGAALVVILMVGVFTATNSFSRLLEKQKERTLVYLEAGTQNPLRDSF